MNYIAHFKLFFCSICIFFTTISNCQDWSEINGFSSNEIVYDIDFTNLSTGLVLTRNSNVYYTGDGAMSWDINTPPTNNQIEAIEVSESQVVWAMCSEGQLYNGFLGQGLVNWNLINTPTNQDLNSAHFESPFEGWVVGDNATLIFFAPGFGGPVLQNVPGFTGDFNDIIMVEDLGLIVTSQNRVIISRNRGRTWSLGSTLPFTANSRIEYYNGVFYVFSEFGGLMSSIDGVIWNSINVPSTDLVDFDIRSGDLYLVGNEGQSWKSQNASGNWLELTGIPDTISLGAIACLDNGCLTGGEVGKMFWDCETITLGGRVWGDISGDCVSQASEQGYANIQVTTTNSTGTVFQNTFTDENGNYSFQVPEGVYDIVIDPSNFLNLGALSMTFPCDTATNPNLNVANDQNGTIINGVVQTKFPVELRCGEELGPFGVINQTVDFGFTYACTNAHHPSSHDVCNQPIFICDLNQIDTSCYSMTVDLFEVADRCGKGDSLSNTSWFTFYAGYGDYDLSIELQGCFPGDQGIVGANIGLIDECGDSTAIQCVNICGGGTVASIGSQFMIPGQVYSFFIDGCGGSICGYSISVEGDYNPFVIPEPMMINCNDESCDKVCTNSVVTFEVIDTQSLYEEVELTFTWELSYNGAIISTTETDSNVVDLPIGQAGIYDICLTQITSNCEQKDLYFCTSIEAVDIEDEDFGTVELCFLDYVLFEGPLYVDNDPMNTSDPNGDGIPGWIMPSSISFISGYNEQTIEHPYGCEYDQYFNLIQLPDSEVAEFEIVVCNSNEFPINILGQSFNGPVNNQSITIPGGAQNGCDSLNNVTIHHLDYQGEIIQEGCDSNGVNLVFVPTIAINSGSFPLEVVWTDANNNEIPQDGDGDPFTITVPYGNNIYSISISSNVNNIRTCSYSFSGSVNLGIPTINSPDSICVGDTSVFLFILPNGIDAGSALWNVDGGEFINQFEVGTPVEILWDTPGVKNITLAYLQDGCYVETNVQLVVLSKLMSSDVLCESGQNYVLFSWTNVPFSEVVSVDVITGQMGVLDGDTFLVDDLNAGENVIINLNVTSTACNDYDVLSACSTLGCDSINGLPDLIDCESNDSVFVCDISSLGDGCKTFNAMSTDNSQIPCAQGSVFSENWIPFTAGDGVYTILIDVNNCALNDGFQFALIKGCDFNSPVVCSSSCGQDIIEIESSLLETGEKYTIWINGCNGNICDYSLEVSGSFGPYQLPVPIDILVSGEATDSIVVCESDSLYLEAIFNPGFNFTNGVEFNWTIQDLSNGDTTEITTQSTALSDQLVPGAYAICLVDLVHHCDELDFAPICLSVQVNKEYNDVIVSCEATDSTIVFSWDTDPGHVTYNVNVLTGQQGTLDSNTFTIVDLMANEVVTIVLETSVLNGCDTLLSTETTCIANPCQSVEVLITPVGPLELCLASDTIDFSATLNPFTQGNGIFTGSGIIDSVQGIFVAENAGVGSHTIEYIFTGDDGCISTGETTVEVFQNIEASFVINPDPSCTTDTVIVTFTGNGNPNTNFTWNFEGANDIMGSDVGPYNLIYDSVGQYVVSLSLEDPLCGSKFVSDTLTVETCESCICDNIIDTMVNCSTIFDPVCGCDGITYNNACEAQYYGGVQFWSSGPCTAMELDTIKAVCDDNNPETVNDVINELCECEGEIIISTKDILSDLRLYPNPTRDKVFLSGFTTGRVIVYDLLGKKVFDRMLQTNELDLSVFEAGWYIIKTHDATTRVLKI